MPNALFCGGRSMLANAVPSLLQHVRRLAATASSDEQLLADFLTRRSDEAFAALLGRHGPMVLNVCRRILHDAHAAEDVFQATFLVLAGRAGAIHRRASLAGFLHGVAYLLAVRAPRRRMQGLPTAVFDKAGGAVAVPGPLQAATLAAAGARAGGGWAAGTSALTAARNGISLLLSTSGKKVGALVALAVLGAAVCLAYSWNSHADQAGGARG